MDYISYNNDEALLFNIKDTILGDLQFEEEFYFLLITIWNLEQVIYK